MIEEKKSSKDESKLWTEEEILNLIVKNYMNGSIIRQVIKDKEK